jgi:hypothetical protein
MFISSSTESSGLAMHQGDTDTLRFYLSFTILSPTRRVDTKLKKALSSIDLDENETTWRQVVACDLPPWIMQPVGVGRSFCGGS